MEERNIMGELNMYRQLGLKPNFSEIGRRYGLDRHTVALYWNEGGDVGDGQVQPTERLRCPQRADRREGGHAGRHQEGRARIPPASVRGVFL